MARARPTQTAPRTAPDRMRADADSRQMRRIALVIAGTALIWLGLNWLGPRLGLAGEYAFLIDLAAGAAFILVAGAGGGAVAPPRRGERMRTARPGSRATRMTARC